MAAPAGCLLELHQRDGSPTPKDILPHRVIAYSRFDSPTAWSSTYGTNAISVAVQPKLHVSAAEGTRSRILAGLGNVISSWLVFTPHLAADTVRPVLTDRDRSTLAVQAMFPRDRKSSRRAQAFVGWLESSIGR